MKKESLIETNSYKGRLLVVLKSFWDETVFKTGVWEVVVAEGIVGKSSSGCALPKMRSLA